MEKTKDEARQQVAEMETSDRNYAIAAVQNVVGIDDRVKQITHLLEMEVNDEVSIIGIYGTDGIGKTTLAKAVYDRISSCFDSCSFLAEVEETSQNPSGIQFLQTKLIGDLLERDHEAPSFDERIEDFQDIFHEMKVLIVIDDVEKQSHLHAIVGDQPWFGLGSRIIVTSQNEEILKGYDPEKACTYMVDKLDDDQAFELFCQHAFGKKSPVPGYDGHANCVVNATEKLPLAIEVIGSFLRGKSIGEWEKIDESIKKFMSSSQRATVCFAEILDLCYEGLDPKQKHIFLEMACFITGVDARVASYMWPNSYLPSPDCVLMPLAKIGENNELQMHRLLRRVGRRILNQKGSGDPTRRKFYIPDMVPKAISKEKGMENVEALCIDQDDHDSCKFTAGDFESLPDKTFLKLDNAKVFGDFTGAFPRVKWLCWQRCPLDFNAENIVLGELVILDLSWSKVTEDWRGWSEIKMEKLKVLNLTGCSDLLFTPDFSGYKDLEILILEQCSRLVRLDPSISHLKRLISLNLKFCSQLNGLPVELGCMTALKELSIDGTSVRQIPISISNLKHLEILSGFKCLQLTYLPSSISYLAALSKLSLDGAKINELPSSLGELLNLRLLSLRDCRYIEELPDSIGKMRSLEELDISATSISNFPDSIRNLQSLRVLRMDSTFIRAFPGEIGNLTKLEELHASWCRSLKGAIPSDIRGLRNLRSLALGHSSISSLSPEISTISGLHTLDLLHCNEIEELPKLPPSLVCLHVSSERMKALPHLEDLKELEELWLSDGDLKAHRRPSKEPMPESNVNRMIDKQCFSISFPKLRKLELSLSQVIKLKFELTDMPPLKRLKMLTVPGSSYKGVSELPKTLSVFKLYHSAIEEIEGLEGLEALKRLDISNCKIQNLNGVDQLTSLRSLILSDCDYLSLPDLSNLKSLKILEIRRCKMIRQIKGLEKLTSLEKLDISECPAENSVQVQKALKHEFESTDSGTEIADPPQKMKRKRETESATQKGKGHRPVIRDLVGMEDRIAHMSLLGGEYHVFLSFRGSDTCCSFTDILQQALVDAGIRVFINDEGLRPNERISDNLLQVIDNSKLYIPIFSKDYASSHWCLDELVKMVENSSKHKEDGKEKVILPIFYNVEPDDVKLKTALYKNNILNLEQMMEDQKHKFSTEDIKTWRQALIEVGRIEEGWQVENDTSHAELIEAVVDKVMARLKTRQRRETRDLVGMEDQIADIKNLLDIDPSGAQLIGIYGMGGIGKTTLAKIIFNQQCPQYGRNCIFLDDVRETAKSGGLVVLQKKLLSCISKEAHEIDDIEVGINTIEETICNKKMLIVLDDVAETDQIQNLIGEKFLYPGTIIIVTTRDKNVLESRNVKYRIAYHKMRGLSDEYGLKLFSRYAFNDDSPPANYCTLSKDIVYTTYGLPLALQAIGSALFQEKKGIWEEWLEKLKETPLEDVLAKLRICYDALKLNEQEIFLDIACFLVGENKTNPMYVWKDCKFYPENAIQVLIDRCMIKELDDNNFWMHDHFRDIGRAIAKKDRTRLWDKEDIIRELKSTENKESVQALRLKSRDLSEPITSEQIRRFPSMRFLSLCEVVCKGDFAGCLSELKWISLDYGYAIPPGPAAQCHQWFEATNSLHLENVVVVNLSGVDITEDVFKSLIKGARKLKVLTLCYNTSIHGMPTFPQNSGLEKLTISKFFSLKEIDCSIGKLTKLTDLSFELCVELEKLSEQIGELWNLQHLSLRSCDSLRELPDSILNLTSLMRLNVLGTRITRLPDSIDRLSSLSSVNVSFTSIEKLPNTISKLFCLQTLHLINCDQIQELPDLPRSLTTLRLTSTSLVTIPNLSYLTNLVELALSDGSESMAKSDIIQPCNLQWIGSLSRLSKLQFCFSNVCVSTIDLCSLSLLEELTLHGLDVPAFKQLPFPSKLIVLELYDTGGKQIRPLRSKKETAIVSSSSRESWENKVLRQTNIKSIEDRKWSEGSVRLRKKPRCNEPQAPEFIYHWRGRLYFPRSLNMLRKFVLWGCPGVQDIEFVSTLKSLLVFSVGGCTSLKRLGGLSNLKYLMELTLNRCWSLQVVEGVDELEFLHQLKIDLCGSVKRIFDPLISKIPNMCSILITHSGKLPDSDPTLDTWESYKEKILSSEDVSSFLIVPIPSSNSIYGVEEFETTESEKQTGKRKLDYFS